jgi:hypothetical protein
VREIVDVTIYELIIDESYEGDVQAGAIDLLIVDLIQEDEIGD